MLGTRREGDVGPTVREAQGHGTPETPPGHGNWGDELPVVYRWAYDYNVPGATQDFLPQNMPPTQAGVKTHE